MHKQCVALLLIFVSFSITLAIFFLWIHKHLCSCVFNSYCFFSFCLSTAYDWWIGGLKLYHGLQALDTLSSQIQCKGILPSRRNRKSPYTVPSKTPHQSRDPSNGMKPTSCIVPLAGDEQVTLTRGGQARRVEAGERARASQDNGHRVAWWAGGTKTTILRVRGSDENCLENFTCFWKWKVSGINFFKQTYSHFFSSNQKWKRIRLDHCLSK